VFSSVFEAAAARDGAVLGTTAQLLLDISSEYPHYRGRYDEVNEILKRTAMSRIESLVDDCVRTESHVDDVIRSLELEWKATRG
jgi:hypothetical protein